VARARRKCRIASGIALANWVGLAVCGIISLGLELSSRSLPLSGLVLLGLAWNERRGRTLLLAADPRAPRRLAFNQLLLLLVVVVYCVHSAYVAWTGPSPLDALLEEEPELGEMLGDDASLAELAEWARTAALVVYGAVAALSLLVQSLLALYYLSLRAVVATLAAETGAMKPSDAQRT
jgi:hypothetical protein